MKTTDCYYTFLLDAYRCTGLNYVSNKSIKSVIGGGKLLLSNVLFPKNISLAFCFWFRLCKCSNRLIRTIAKYKRIRLTRKYGVQIASSTCIGAGLFFPHFLPMVIHPKAIIGRNCTIHQFVTIGGDSCGYAPNIGDNCFIGAGATLIGHITIGNNVTIGAGAVVLRDIEDNATVAGVPAKTVHFGNPGKYIVNPIPL